MSWKIGCSGFYYPEWKGVFYPKGVAASKWFEYYCEHFDTVELNGTFYRTPKVTQLKNWFAKSPKNFMFSMKAPRTITHYKKFSNVAADVAEFYDLATKGLAEKLGCILFQLPPSFAFSEQNLRSIVNTLDPVYNNVIEFRNLSWWRPEVYEVLREKRITFCNISHPSLPDAVVKTSSTLYYRFHGVPELYKSLYEHEVLNSVAAEIKNQRADHNYIYFNNTAHGVAIRNAYEFKSLLQDHLEAIQVHK